MTKKLSRVERKERPMREAIQRRYNETYPVDQACVKQQTQNWNKVCDLMIAEMEAEGLNNSVDLIKQFKK